MFYTLNLTIPADGLQDYVHCVLLYMFYTYNLTIPCNGLQDYVDCVLLYMIKLKMISINLTRLFTLMLYMC